MSNPNAPRIIVRPDGTKEIYFPGKANPLIVPPKT